MPAVPRRAYFIRRNSSAVLLEFHFPIDGQQYVKFVLSGGQERAIFERDPRFS
jgi:hypothetical protein